ncbi:MAG: nucleotidyltransferase family protein [Candidatus Aenigmarchaeota archaeon]|nr:nucleotidyltransferase family protein [Candidatus Aenigmarchaeota archaeon]
MLEIKAIVLAGGTAERLKPLTENMPKPLIDVNGRHMIDDIIDKLEAAGIREIYVSTNERFEEPFRAWSKGRNVKLVVEKMPGGKKLGAIAGLAYVAGKEKIAGDCLVIAGDNLFGFDLKDFIAFYHAKKKPVVAAYDVKSRERASQFGVITEVNGKITSFEEKPEKPKSTLAATACYIFPQEALNSMGEYLRLGNARDSPGNFIAWLAGRTGVYAYIFDNYWFDIGTLESLKEARAFMKRL